MSDLRLTISIAQLGLHVREALEAFDATPHYLHPSIVKDLVKRVTEDPTAVEPHDHPDCTTCHGFGEPPTDDSRSSIIPPDGLKEICHEAFDEGVIRGAGRKLEGTNNAFIRWWNRRSLSFSAAVAGERLDASAFGLGLPGAKPREETTQLVHLGRGSGTIFPLRTIKAGETYYVGQVSWCIEKPVEGSDTLTRIVNLVTCQKCLEYWRVYCHSTLDEFQDYVERDRAAHAQSLDEGMKGM